MKTNNGNLSITENGLQCLDWNIILKSYGIEFEYQ